MIHEAKKEYVFALQNYLKAFSIFKRLNSPYSQLASEHILELKDKMREEEFYAVLEKLREQNDS
jgi:predicted P-loop ATPase/GTPase